jgi:mevalonate kinase
MKSFYSRGKLLLSAEYLVLKGARALALPCKLGQTLSFEKKPSRQLLWKSLDKNGVPWFNASFLVDDFSLIKTDNTEVADRLRHILLMIRYQNPIFLKLSGGNVITRLEFDRYWGLGTSSTLIVNLANWASVNPYALLKETFGGSGYDIACASAEKALIYSCKMERPEIEDSDFDPKFKNALYFVYLNQKKYSRQAVKEFMKKDINDREITRANELSLLISTSESLSEFELLLWEHERFIGQLLSIEPIKEKYFKDFKGAVKSLGAWGGDFILATGDSNTPNYFKDKGYSTIFTYDELIY